MEDTMEAVVMMEEEAGGSEVMEEGEEEVLDCADSSVGAS
jgi:hypothetical protein